MPKKPGFSLEQHEQLGLELQTMRDRLGEITVELSMAYPFKISDITKKAQWHLDSLRCILDDKVCEENQQSKDATRVYFRAGRPDYQRPKKSKV